MVSGLRKVWAEEGLRGLSSGLYASWAREISYSSCRIGLYDPLRALLAGGETDPQRVGTGAKFAAAFLSGALGSACCNPCDLVKTRQQLAPGAGDPLRLASNWARHTAETRELWRARGLAGLYKGWQATSARAAMLTSAQLGSYDTIKVPFCRPSTPLFVASLSANLASLAVIAERTPPLPAPRNMPEQLFDQTAGL
jgi:hypothetical protein